MLMPFVNEIPQGLPNKEKTEQHITHTHKEIQARGTDMQSGQAKG
jgi:hypothetical protein